MNDSLQAFDMFAESIRANNQFQVKLSERRWNRERRRFSVAKMSNLDDATKEEIGSALRSRYLLTHQGKFDPKKFQQWMHDHPVAVIACIILKCTLAVFLLCCV